MWRIVSILLLALLCAAAEEREVSGRVLDAQGAPVAGIEVASYWYQRDGILRPQRGVKTDADGRFTVKVRWQKRPLSITVLNAGRTEGATVVVNEQSFGEPLALSLAPLVTLRGKVTSTIPVAQAYVAVTAKGAIIAAAASLGKPAFSLPLPPGTYRLTIKPTHCKRIVNTVTIEPGARALDLGTLAAKPTVIATYFGKPLPKWTLTEARGVSKDVQLADYKGKWVLLEFWGFW